MKKFEGLALKRVRGGEGRGSYYDYSSLYYSEFKNNFKVNIIFCVSTHIHFLGTIFAVDYSLLATKNCLDASLPDIGLHIRQKLNEAIENTSMLLGSIIGRTEYYEYTHSWHIR